LQCNKNKCSYNASCTHHSISAKPAVSHAVVAAGDKISLQWLVPWPDSHHGPVLEYLAACNGPCESIDKTALEFFKIDGAGWVSGGNPGL
jgi:endoglucanase